MIGDTIVALFDTTDRAELAVRDLMAAGIPERNIERHEAARDAAYEPGLTEPRRAPGLWERLFGGAAEHDTEFYDRSIERGGTVVTVQPPEGRVDDIVMILEGHHPVDMDERDALVRHQAGAGSAAPTEAAFVVADAPSIKSEPNSGV